VPARGATGEVYLNVMLRDGLSPGDVTVVGVGGPQTAYTSMVVGKPIDAAVTFSPAKELCDASKACQTVVDMTRGEGPALFRTPSASSVVFVVRRQWADNNPALMAAFYAAMKEAATWMRDPANLDELIGFYRPSLKVGEIPNPDELLRNWIKSSVGKYSGDLAVNRDGIKAALDFAVENKMLEKSVDVGRLVWSKAP
jgi:ABC-type nitrate/sulfonate/bicarbonate transport system substrate-binding protein